MSADKDMIFGGDDRFRDMDRDQLVLLKQRLNSQLNNCNRKITFYEGEIAENRAIRESMADDLIVVMNLLDEMGPHV